MVDSTGMKKLEGAEDIYPGGLIYVFPTSN